MRPFGAKVLGAVVALGVTAGWGGVALGQDLVQLQSLPTTAFTSGQSGSALTFSRYNGTGTVTKVELRAQGLVRASYGDAFLGTIGVPYTLDVTLRGFFFVSDSSLGSGAAVNDFTSLPLRKTTQALAVAELSFDTGEQVTTYTDPAFINAFFVGSSNYTYLPSPSVTGFVDQAAVFGSLGYLDPIRYTMAAELRVEYFVAVPEPGTGAMLLGAGVVALRRRRVGVRFS